MKAVRWAVMVGLLGLAVLPEAARAGQRPFIWAFDTKIVPKGSLELEQWLWVRGRAPGVADSPARYWIWWAPVFGLTQRLEVALPFQVRSVKGNTELESFEADVRLRLQPRGDDSPYQQLVRLVYHHAIDTAAPSRVDAHFIQSFQVEDGPRLALDLGTQVGIPALRGREGPVRLQGSYALGLSYPVLEDELSFSLEAYGEVPLRALPGEQRHFVGASVAWTFGRTWVTLGTMVGLTPLFPETPRFMPRLIWAVLL